MVVGGGGKLKTAVDSEKHVPCVISQMHVMCDNL